MNQRQHKIDKLPGICTGPQELQAGDILIFNYNPLARRFDSGGFITRHNQRFLNERGGHRAAVHTGFIVNTDDGLKLAHVVGRGFQLDDLDSPFLKRTVHVYRPRRFQRQLAEELSDPFREHPVEDVSEMEFVEQLDLPLNPRREQALRFKRKLKKLKWDVIVGVRAFIHRLFTSLMIVSHDPEARTASADEKFQDDVISKNTICSKYVADSYISACHRLTNSGDNIEQINYRTYFMNISSLTPPKALQAYLYRNTNYDYFVMPHKREHLYAELRNVIIEEVTRLKGEVLVAARNKGRRLERALVAFEQQPQEMDRMRQCIALLKHLAPILKHNTGSDFRTPSSWRRVIAFARSEGIYQDYIDDDLHDRSEKKIKALVQKHYHYNKPMARLYRNYRRIGYSDEEAKFECQPDFSRWYALSPTRNAILSATVIGFFAWVLPRGITRVKEASARNTAYEQNVLRQIRAARFE